MAKKPESKAGEKAAAKPATATARKRTAKPSAEATPAEKPARKRAPAKSSGPSDAERQRQIADKAYFKAKARGFEPGHEEEDWLEAEREYDAEVRGR